MNLSESYKNRLQELSGVKLNEVDSIKTYVVNTSQEALEDEMYDAQGEVQQFLGPAIDGEPEDTYEDLFGDYKHPEIMAISDIDFTLDGIKLMISKQGKSGRKIIDSLKKSMKQGKPVPPVTVKKDFTGEFGLISGRHRLLAALELGLTHLPVLKMYWRDKINKLNEGVLSILDKKTRNDEKYELEHWDAPYDKRKIKGVFVHMRFGLPEKDEHGNFKNSSAYNGSEKRYEEGGISVYEGLYDGKNIYVFAQGSMSSTSYDTLFNSSRKAYVVSGRLTDNDGTDMELLLDKKKFKVICEVPKRILIKSS